MHENYEIKVPATMNPRTLVTNMSFRHENEKLIEKLKKPNRKLNDSRIKILVKRKN